jgi:hypothetical protein
MWGVIKRDFKKRLALSKFELLDQPAFEKLLKESLDIVTKDM